MNKNQEQKQSYCEFIQEKEENLVTNYKVNKDSHPKHTLCLFFHVFMTCDILVLMLQSNKAIPF